MNTPAIKEHTEEEDLFELIIPANNNGNAVVCLGIIIRVCEHYVSIFKGKNIHESNRSNYQIVEKIYPITCCDRVTQLSRFPKTSKVEIFKFHTFQLLAIRHYPILIPKTLSIHTNVIHHLFPQSYTSPQ